jgi:light-regulated signal transduction histidine kinase (bacteriophytochrome)
VASQELKDYVRGIDHLANVLKRSQGDALDDQGRQQIATILKITRRMDSLVDALLDQSRIGRGVLNRELVDLDDVLDTVLASVGHALEKSGIEVRRPSSLGTARCHRAWVSEVLATLVSNAISFNEKSTRWMEIGAEQGNPTRYYVRDNGIGIAPADQDVIFELFRRLHGPADFGGGSGIGLALARKIVEHHGGRMWVRSVPGEGSTFYFTLEPGE